MKLPRLISIILVVLCVAGFFYFIIPANQNAALVFTFMGGAILFMVGSVYLKKKEPKEEKSDSAPVAETAEVDFDPNIMNEEQKPAEQNNQQPPTQ